MWIEYLCGNGNIMQDKLVSRDIMISCACNLRCMTNELRKALFGWLVIFSAFASHCAVERNTSRDSKAVFEFLLIDNFNRQFQRGRAVRTNRTGVKVKLQGRHGVENLQVICSFFCTQMYKNGRKQTLFTATNVK